MRNRFKLTTTLILSLFFINLYFAVALKNEEYLDAMFLISSFGGCLLLFIGGVMYGVGAERIIAKAIVLCSVIMIVTSFIVFFVRVLNEIKQH